MLEKNNTIYFIQNIQKKLIEKNISNWPRRNMKMLEINSHNGIFLPLYLEMGFDVDCTDSNHINRENIKNTFKSKINIIPSIDIDLQIDDKAYDWVILHLYHKDEKKILQAISEASRVTARCLIITFWNKWSLSNGGKNLDIDIINYAHSFWLIKKIIKNVIHKKISISSTLTGPTRSWNTNSIIASCNRWCNSLPFGAWCVAKVNIAPYKPLTTTLLRVKQFFRKPETINANI